jgi:NADH-quinone oxidoreductase subunit L
MADIPEFAVWLIFLIPIIAAAFIAFVIRPFFNNRSQLAGYITIAAIGVSLALSLWTLYALLQTDEHQLEFHAHQWVVIGSHEFSLGIMVDSLTVTMLVVVGFCSLMVQIYSQGYMHGDPGYSRYFASMALFTGSMLGLVLAGNLIQLYVFWELVGLCSYLLIGFWFHRPSAAAAAKKAFLVTRLGDFGLLAAILFLYFKTGTADIGELHVLAVTGAMAASTLTLAAIGIFAGAAGKSAQFPLHVWLPDAMEGPTPVSALIHSSTMVTAGVFLVARTFPIFIGSETALTVVASVGAFTAIFAASMALVATDIKRVLAYCTISQLGYMMLGLGAVGLLAAEHGAVSLEVAKGVVVVGIFHLVTHAFAKALLFLGSGSVNHATGTFDMRLMGGLRKHLPWTYLTFLVGSICMAGVWPLACFWSKDEILVKAFELGDARVIFFYLGMITAFMTAFYMFRVIFLTFHGEYRGGASAAAHGQNDHGHGEVHLHESPRVMVIPMLLLMVLAVTAGLANVTGWFDRFFGEHVVHGWFHFIEVFWYSNNHYIALISTILVLVAIDLASAIYNAKWISAEAIGRMFRTFYRVLINKYWFDELYERVIVVRVLIDGVFRVCQVFDTYIVDGLVNGVAGGTIGAGRLIRNAETGKLQTYGLVMFAGILTIVALVYWLT